MENSIEIYEVEHNILSASGTIGINNVQGCSEIIYQINIYSYSLGNKLNPRVFTKNVRHNFIMSLGIVVEMKHNNIRQKPKMHQNQSIVIKWQTFGKKNCAKRFT